MNSILIASIIFLIAGILWYTGWRVVSWRARLRRETREAGNVLHAVFDTLRQDVTEQFKSLKKVRGQKGNREEQERILEDVKENMSVAERFAKKEIEDVEKELE